jgi:hypothetical protein
MGYESMLEFDVAEPNAVDQLLRGIPGFERYDPAYELYLFRRVATGSMPDAHAKIEAGGVYVCDNGCGAEVVSDIRAALSAIAPHLTVRELWQ